jgi:hypothetical protein
MFVGRAVGGVPAGVTAAVGAVELAALPPEDVAVVTTLSECPTSALATLYVSYVAPEIAAQLTPAASQRLHVYENRSGFPPSQAPGTAASSWPACGGPTTVGGIDRTGGPVG